jgi:hypothetical protein
MVVPLIDACSSALCSPRVHTWLCVEGATLTVVSLCVRLIACSTPRHQPHSLAHAGLELARYAEDVALLSVEPDEGIAVTTPDHAVV